MQIDIEKLALEAKLTYEAADPNGGSYFEGYVNDAESRARFASLVLEEAAKALDARVMGDNNREDQEAKRCAEAIRTLSRQITDGK